MDLAGSFGGRREGIGLIGDGTALGFGAGAGGAAIGSEDAGTVDKVVEGCHVVLARIGTGITSRA